MVYVRAFRIWGWGCSRFRFIASGLGLYHILKGSDVDCARVRDADHCHHYSHPGGRVKPQYQARRLCRGRNSGATPPGSRTAGLRTCRIPRDSGLHNMWGLESLRMASEPGGSALTLESTSCCSGGNAATGALCCAARVEFWGIKVSCLTASSRASGPGVDVAAG